MVCIKGCKMFEYEFGVLFIFGILEFSLELGNDV